MNMVFSDIIHFVDWKRKNKNLVFFSPDIFFNPTEEKAQKIQ